MGTSVLESFVCLDVVFFICRFSSMRFHFDLKCRCSCCCSFSELFDCHSSSAKCLSLVLLLTLLFRLHLPIFSQPSAALGCGTNKAWVLSWGCHIMPRQRPPVPDGLSWILPQALRVQPFLFFLQINITSSVTIFPPFCLNLSHAVTVPRKR